MVIFISIAIAAFIIVAGSFLFGSDHDAGHDGDAGHDVGDGDSEPTISIFSSKVIATLLMGFGAAGAIARSYELSYLVASLIGLGCGLLLGGAMYGVLSLFYRQQASSLVSTNSAVGCTGRVTVSIGESAQGEVALELEGQYSTFVASSADGKPIARGQSVRVVRTMGSQLVVEKV
jgi:membrane protein implicated in regulation of membrane protease activity